MHANPAQPKENRDDISNLGISIAQHAPLPMALLEGDVHIIRYVNPAFCLHTGKSSEQLLGKSFSGILPEKDRCMYLLDRVFRTGRPESHTEKEHSETHPLFWSYAMWPVLTDKQTSGIMLQVTETASSHAKTLAMNEALLLGSLRQHELHENADLANNRLQHEIKERKLAEEALRHAKAQLADRAVQLEELVMSRTWELTAMNRQLEAFAYSIAHDLRAPLRIMQGFSSMLVAEAGPALNDTGRNYADRINRSAQFMDSLLTGLLAYSCIARQHIELAPVDLKKVVETVLSRLQKEIQEKNALVQNCGPWPIVLAHEPTLERILFNLKSNALKFVTPGMPPILRLWTENRGEFTRVWVEDNGPGIAPEHQAQIFQLFSRLEGEKHGGTGVGLAIVQKGVEHMGGHGGVESSIGHGSRFWFELRNSK